MKPQNSKTHFLFMGHDIYLITSTQGAFFVYAPTLRRVFQISSTLAHRLMTTGLVETPKSKGEQDLLARLRAALPSAIQPFPFQARKSKFFHLGLGLTMACTLNCLYCHADSGQRKHMAPSLMRAAIHHAFAVSVEQQLKGVSLSFALGGEPTANWSTFKSAVQLAQTLVEDSGVPCHISMTTNGYYGQDKRRFISQHVDDVLLSFDGPPDIQDLHRPTTSARGSSQVVAETAKYLFNKSRSFALRSTVSNHSVQRLSEIVQYFADLLKGPTTIVFEPLVPVGRAERTSHLLNEPDQRLFVENFIDARRLGQKLGFEVKTSAALQSRLVTSFCGAIAIPAFAVTHEGKITMCHRDSSGTLYDYGSYSAETGQFSVDHSRLKELADRYLSLPDKCNDCFCKWHCAGDCPDVRRMNYDRCEANRFLVLSDIEELVRMKNGTPQVTTMEESQHEGTICRSPFDGY